MTIKGAQSLSKKMLVQDDLNTPEEGMNSKKGKSDYSEDYTIYSNSYAEWSRYLEAYWQQKQNNKHYTAKVARIQSHAAHG